MKMNSFLSPAFPKLFQTALLMALASGTAGHALLFEPPPKLLKCEVSLNPRLAEFAGAQDSARDAIADLRARASEPRTIRHLDELATDLGRPPAPGRIARAVVIRGRSVRPAFEAFTAQTKRLEQTYAELRREQRTGRRFLEKAIGGAFVIPKIDLLFFHLPELLMRDGWMSFQVPETFRLLIYSPVMVAALAAVATVEFLRATHFEPNSGALARDLARLSDGLLTRPQIHSVEVDLNADVAHELRVGDLNPESRARAYAGLRRTWVGLATKAFAGNLNDEGILETVGDLDHVKIDHVLFEDEGEPVWVIVARFARQEQKVRPRPARRIRRPAAPVGWPRPA